MSTTELQANSENVQQQQVQIPEAIQQNIQPVGELVEQQAPLTFKPRLSTQIMKSYMSVLTTGPQDTFDEISQEDIDYLNMKKYEIGLYPIVSFLGLTGLKKVVELVKIPEILRNPLLPPKVNVQRGQYFKNFMSKNILFIACAVSTMGGFAVYEVNKYYMYLKYKNLIESYLDANEREYLNDLSFQGKNVDLQLRSNVFNTNSTFEQQQQQLSQELQFAASAAATSQQKNQSF